MVIFDNLLLKMSVFVKSDLGGSHHFHSIITTKNNT